MIKISLSKEEEKRFCEEFITFYSQEMDEKIGIIQAQIFLDFFLESMGPEIYNEGIDVAKNKVRDKFEEFDFELEELKK